MPKWLLNIALALVLIPTATLGLVLTRHALADSPPDIHTATALPTGTSAWSLVNDGQSRTFRVYVPAYLNQSAPAPLVVMLHGRYGSGKQVEKANGWDSKADAEGFVVLYPDGLRRSWNAGDCCGYAGRSDIDDVGFITAAIDQLEEKIAIDTARVFATGISNGGRMTYRLACETDRFAAIAPVAATLMVECLNPAPLSVLHIHGLEDRLIRFDGSPGLGADEVDGPPVPEVIAMWRSVDDCSSPISIVDGTVVRETSDCIGGKTVTLITLADAGHEWPSSGSFDATSVIWEFFSETAAS